VTDRFVSTMRRYVVDYTNTGDVGLIEEIMAPEYRITIAGEMLDRDAYRRMVEGAYAHFPDLKLVVHDLFTNGERLAMRFSEHATSPGHGGRRAAWSGISLYRRTTAYRLTECLVEQDFYGRRSQLAAGVSDPMDKPMDRPWSVRSQPPQPGAEETVRAWVSAGMRTPSGVFVVDDSRHRDGPAVLSDPVWAVDDLFSAGDKVAARLTASGMYSGGLFGISDDAIGIEVELAATCIALTSAGTVTNAWLVTDRFGLQQRLKRG
jgi:predicted ester cyclase